MDKTHKIATPKTILDRKKTAIKMYKNSKLNNDEIKDQLRGIDFKQDVEIVKILKGTKLEQWQVSGRNKGNYFALPGSHPSGLGISATAQDSNGLIVSKSAKLYSANSASEDLTALKSTANSVIDSWSIPGENIGTEGGLTQLYINDPNTMDETK